MLPVIQESKAIETHQEPIGQQTKWQKEKEERTVRDTNRLELTAVTAVSGI